MRIGDSTVRVAALADIIKSKRAANRPRDRAVLEILEKTREAIEIPRKARLAQLREQSDRLEMEMIRRRVAASFERRMNFLRKRIGICSSCL